MHVVYIAHNEIPGTSAAGVNVMRMAQAIAREGHDVTLLATPSADPKLRSTSPHDYYGTLGEFRVKSIAHTSIANLGRVMFALRCLRELRSLSPDLVYSRELITCVLAQMAGHRTVFEAHHPIHRESPAKLWMVRRLAHSSHVPCIVAISGALRDVLVEEARVPQTKLVIAHDGADELRTTSRVAALRDPGARCNVGYVGSLHAGKGIELIADVAPAVPGALFHVIGGSPEQVEYWRDRIPRGNLHFYGRVSPSEVPAYIQAMDICLLPNQPIVRSKGGNDISRFTSPLKMFEYMAAGKAIVCSDLPVLREVLDETTSVLAEATNPQAWVAAIGELAASEGRRHQLGQAALARFLAEFSWSTRARNVLRHSTSDLQPGVNCPG